MTNETVTAIPSHLREHGTNARMWARQRMLEEESARVGVDRFMRSIRKAEEKGRAGSTAPSKALIARVIAPIAEMIRTDMEDRAKGKPTRRQSVVRLVFTPTDDKGRPLITPEVAAFISLRDTFNTLYLRQKAKHLALTIGQSLEDELRWYALRQADRASALRIRGYLKGSTTHHRHRRFALMGFLRRWGVSYTPWTVDKHLQVGRHMMEYMERIGLIAVTVTRTGKKETNAYVTPTEQTREWIIKRTETVLASRPGQMPLVVPPKPWTALIGGGFWFRGRYGEDIAKRVHIPRPLSPLPFIRGVPGDWLRKQKPEVLQPHIDAVNALQGTSWRVNSTIYAAAKRAWDRGMVIAGLPPRDTIALPPKPEDIKTNEAARRAWKRQAREVHHDNAVTNSLLIAADRTLKMAARFLDHDRFWFAYQCDFRGRVYPVADYMHPQGSDLARALLVFGDAVPLGSPEAADWLAIHVANTWGNDKVPFADRIAWTRQHSERIVACAEDPLNETWWTEADKKTRWQFLAACIEWAGYMREGLAWRSAVPIALDGTCSGLQHYSVLLRDEVGGRATNLTPSDAPNDIYRDVARETMAELRRWSEDSSVKGRYARAWIEFGVDRKVTKRPTMTLPYGSTPISAMKYVHEAVSERIGEGAYFDITDADERREAIVFLSMCVWRSIGAVVGPAQDCMQWIQGVIREAVKKAPASPIEWRSPTGFPVRQWYAEKKERLIKSGYGDSALQFRVVCEGDSADIDGMVSAGPPNFIHSLDGAHLAFVVRKLKEEGLRHFGVIHDSFGTHAAHTGHLASVLRTELVRLYAEHDPLGDLAARLGAKTTPPPLGNLDLGAILRATYSFA